MLSIIVPAHNEGSIIERSVGALVRQAGEVPYQVVVVANGCSDDTAAKARGVASSVRPGCELTILELAQGGKINALNAGDEAARYKHRIYCDGDLVVSPNLVLETADRLKSSEPIYLSFRLEPKRSRSFITNAYARMWRRLPLLESAAHGIALYAVNQAGRARWEKYPDIVADDYFARMNFSPKERERVDKVHYEFVMPEGLFELIQVRTRWARGVEEFQKAFPELKRNEDGGRYKGFAARCLRHPVDFGAFVLVYAAGKVQGKLRAKAGNAVWERASRSRVGSETGSNPSNRLG